MKNFSSNRDLKIFIATTIAIEKLIRIDRILIKISNCPYDQKRAGVKTLIYPCFSAPVTTRANGLYATPPPS